jgi:AcrR family transcriptional regulator
LVKLTKRLVRSGRRRGPAPAADGLDSRGRLFAAAAREFAARGFAGASVDRIAAAARLNKAMIYYHFGSKAALYRDILRDMFEAVAARVRAVAASPVPPDDKIRQFVDLLADEAEARPHFPPIWFREVAEGGPHLDDATLGEMAGILKGLASILDEGVRAGRFRAVSPFLVHGGVVAPILLFFASAGIRRRIEQAGARGVAGIERHEVVAHVQRVTLGLLEGRMEAGTGRGSHGPRRPGRSRVAAVGMEHA